MLQACTKGQNKDSCLLNIKRPWFYEHLPKLGQCFEKYGKRFYLNSTLLLVGN